MTKKSAIFLVVAGLLVGGVLGTYIALPNIAERVSNLAIGKVEKRLGIQFKVGSFHYTRDSRVAWKDVEIRTHAREGGVSKPIARIGTIQLDFDPVSAFTGRLRLKELAVSEFDVQVVRDAAGEVNVQSVLQKARGAAPSSKEGARPRGGGLGGLTRWVSPHLPIVRFSGGKVTLRDEMEDGGLLGFRTFHLEEIELESTDKSLVQEASELDFTGSVRIREFKNTLQLKGFATYPRFRYGLSVALEQPLEHVLGNRKVRIGGLGWSMDSDLELQDVKVGAKGDEKWDEDPTIQIGKVQVGLRSVPAEIPSNASVKEKIFSRLKFVRLVTPKVFVERYANRTMNLDDMARRLLPKRMTPADETPPQKAIEKLAPGRKRFKKGDGKIFREQLEGGFQRLEALLRTFTDQAHSAVTEFPLQEFEIRGGTIRFTDELLFGRNFVEEFHNFNLKVGAKDSPEVVGFQLTFESQGAESSKAANALSGRVNLNTRDVQVHLGIRNLDLTPYAALFPASFPIDATTRMSQGDLDLVYNHERELAQVEGLLQLSGLSVVHGSLAPEPLTNVAFDAEISAVVDLRTQQIGLREGLFGLNDLEFQLQGKVESYGNGPQLDFQFRLPETKNQRIVDAIPREFIPKLKDVKVRGSFGWELDLSLDSTDPESLRYEARPKLTDYKLLSIGKEINFKSVRGPFTQVVVESEDKTHEFETGPGSLNWAPYDEISPWMTQVVTTTEDGSFFRHEGISTFAMKDSMITNIERGGFVRGASTISQQLVKNLFLGREKTLSRKFQELFITWEMEKVFEKEELLALYFNVIEFGPEIYGIVEAANHYFGKHPRSLSLVECLFLGSLIPNPKKYYFQYENGQLTDNWRKRLAFFGKSMFKRKKIDQATYASLEPYRVRFVKRGPNGERIMPGTEPMLGSEDEQFIPAHELDEIELEREENNAFDAEIAP